MCELINSARKLAESRGLDPNCIECPKSVEQVCTGEECIFLNSSSLEQTNQQLSNPVINIFYNRLQKTAALRKN